MLYGYIIIYDYITEGKREKRKNKKERKKERKKLTNMSKYVDPISFKQRDEINIK